jgi:acyl-CoA reductase-like NAD-dependent aldehyde dehydrogenase
VPDNALSLALREPIGVCGQIIPWNYPLLMAAWKIAPGRVRGLHGCTQAGGANAADHPRAGETFRGGRPSAGVVNIVTGAAETGAALTAHPDVDKIAFTGSAEVGRSSCGARRIR